MFTNKKFQIWGLLGSLIYATLMEIGAATYSLVPVDLRFFTKEQILINIKFFIQNILVFFVMFLLMCFVQIIMSKPHNSVRNNALIWYLAPILFVCYLIVFLAYFPGIAGYDSYMQIPQALGAYPLTNHHPVLHTLFIRLCIRVGNLFPYEAAGLVVYSISAIILCSIGITYSLYLISSKITNPFILILSGCWFALYPTFSLLSFNANKDMFFSVSFVLFAEKLYLNLSNSAVSRKDCLELVLWGILSSLLRNNAVYALAVLAVFLFLIKRTRNKNALCVLIAVCISFSVTHIVYPACGIEDSPVQESLSIPIQQMASVYCLFYNELDEETRNTVEHFIPDAAVFNVSTVDFVKLTFNGKNYKSDKSSFWNTWASLGKQHPAEYFRYAVLLNLESWFPQYEFKDPYYYTCYISTVGPEELFMVNRRSFLPHLMDFYEQYASYSHPWMEMPVIGFLFSCSLPFVFLFVSLIYLLATGKYKPILFFLPFILFWLTHLLGPLCNIRYFLSILLMMPIAMIIMSEPKVPTE